MRLLAAVLMLCVVPGVAAAARAGELQQPQEFHPIPVDLVISDLREAYSQRTAEEVTVRYRAPQAPMRSEAFTIRIDPGPDPERRPQQVLLELGPLRVHFADGRMTAINRAAPERYVEQAFDGPITAELVGELLPPLPLPQLRLAGAEEDLLAAPTPYTPGVMWTSARLYPDERPVTMELTGLGDHGAATLVATANDARLRRIEANISGGGGEAVMELRMRPVAPGDPAMWSIDTEGRERVSSLAELRRVARTGPMPVGTPVPDLAFERRDGSRWSLYSALRAAEALAPPGEAAAPVALVMLRIPADYDAVRPRLKLGYEAVLEPLKAGRVSDVAVSAITPLAEFSRDHRDATRAMWMNKTANRDRAGELLWGYSPGQSIELFHPDAAAILVLVAEDRRLVEVIRLDAPEDKEHSDDEQPDEDERDEELHPGENGRSGHEDDDGM